jgi:hypothetical protein
MSLDTEVAEARRGIFRDGYDMSFGEIASLYERGDLVISPEYQRLFRWDESKKTRFIESLLLTIPIPPIFVFSDEDGRWELVDGLQRVSTILEFMGVLKSPEGAVLPPFVCDGTQLVPALNGARWAPSNPAVDGENVLSPSLQNAIRRARLRIEILSQQTDPYVKYELFQRLNTGGANLTEQEIRNVIIISLNRQVYDHVLAMAQDVDFVALTPVGQERINRQYRLELVVRFLVLRNFQYTNGTDVHEYLDQGIVALCQEEDFDWGAEIASFQTTMHRLQQVAPGIAFKKGARWSLALFEFISLGLSRALDDRGDDITDEFIRGSIARIADLPEADRYSGMGVRGTQRLAGLVIPLAERHFGAGAP